MEFKKLSAVEMVEAVSDAASVLIEEDGVIKRAPKNEVGGGAKKELVYEWNFTPDNTAGEILENVDIDLSPLFKDKETKFEVIVEQYCLEKFYDDESGNWTEPEIVADSVSTWNNANQSYMENVSFPLMPEYIADFISIYSRGYDYYSDTGTHAIFCESWAEIMIIKGLNFNFEDGSLTNVENGGIITVCSAFPFKSVKIYKIIK